MAPSDRSVLDDPVWRAIGGAHAAFGERRGAACRYHPDVSVFGALAPDAWDLGGAVLAAAWADLARLVGEGGTVVLVVRGDRLPVVPAGWVVTASGTGVQMVGAEVGGALDRQAVPLGSADVDHLLHLVSLAQPGPFCRRTVELGGYVGRWEDDRLVGMAGVRMRPPGHAEISAVATHPSWRGRGIASGLVRHVAAGIERRAEVPFLHAASENVAAIDLYRRLGFAVRCTMTFVALRCGDQAG